MKLLNALVFLVAFLSINASELSSLNWINSYETGVDSSKTGGQPIFIYFSGQCAVCGKLEREALSSPMIVERLRDFICYQATEGKDASLFIDFKVKAVPTIVMVRPEAGEPTKIVGFIEPRDLLRMMKKFKKIVIKNYY